ncbi:MAG: hypothetical protein E7413_08040 [Ruminococcaceae bacterium]|nr:hypothetical protein [Oscillospiraceae bacterium]
MIDNIHVISADKTKKQTAWQIVYNNFKGPERRAIEFLNKEVGKRVLREEGIYSIYVLPIIKEAIGIDLAKNTILISQWQDSALIQQYVNEDELTEDAYLLKIIDNPVDPAFSLVIITAKKAINLFYGATCLLDHYAPKYAPQSGGMVYTKRIFDQKLPNCTITSAPTFKNRGIFVWGHPINDYKLFFEQAARQGLNQIVLWNQYKPLNADDICTYADSLGIEILWGYSWGWQGCAKMTTLTDEFLQELKEQVIREYEELYADTNAGIYFQSFTERMDDNIGGRSIAKTVTEFVNDTAGELLKRYPNLHIQFGLHANSVHKHLDEIAKVDKRIEIVWENGGTFPFAMGLLRPKDKARYEKEFEQTLDFTKSILCLRGIDAPTCIILKGFAKLEWARFVDQSGPFILGENSAEIREHDKKLRQNSWRAHTADWMHLGKYATAFVKWIQDVSHGNANVCMAGTYDGGVFFPMAACSELFWNPDREFEEIAKAAMDKDFVEID